MVPNTGQYTVAIKHHLDAANTALCSTFRPDLKKAIAEVEAMMHIAQELRSMLKETQLNTEREAARRKGEIF